MKLSIISIFIFVLINLSSTEKIEYSNIGYKIGSVLDSIKNLTNKTEVNNAKEELKKYLSLINSTHTSTTKPSINYLISQIKSFMVYNNFKYEPGRWYKFLNELSVVVIEIILQYNISITDKIFTQGFYDCYNQFNYFFKNDKMENVFRKALDFSGKALNDLGKENSCEKDESFTNYLSLRYYIEDTNRLVNFEDLTIINFLEQHYFYIGFCFPTKCKNLVKSFEDIDTNKEFYNALYNETRLSNMTINYSNDTRSDPKIMSLDFSGKCIIYFFLIYFIVKLLLGLIINMFVLEKGYDRFVIDLEEKSKQNNDKMINGEESQENLNEEKTTKNERISLNYSPDDRILAKNYNALVYRKHGIGASGLYNPIYDKINNYPTYLKLCKLFDLTDNLKVLISLTNKYYNANSIKKFYFLKFIIMIMIVFYYIMESQIKLPSKNFLVEEFYISFNFFFIKLCINGSVFWIIIDSALTGFKFMSFIKKQIYLNNQKDLKIGHVFKFLLLTIPKIIVFVLAFILFNLYASQLILGISDKSNIANYGYYNETVPNSTFSEREITFYNVSVFKSFIPFRLNYIDFFEKFDNTIKNMSNCSGNLYKFCAYEKSTYEMPSPFLTNTELFVNIYLNEFYCLIIFTFIVYICYKFKSKLIEYILLIINIALFILPIFNLNPYKIPDKAEYTLRFVLGQNYTEKYTHYFISFYYFGFMIGVIYYYYCEKMCMIKNKTTDNNNKYSKYINSAIQKINVKMPFKISKKLANFIINLRLSVCFKSVIMVLSIILMIVISSSFFIFHNIYQCKEEKFYNEIICSDYKISNTALLKYTFLYEKYITSIFFMIFVLMLITLPDKNIIAKITESNFFIIIGRINFIFNCMANYIVLAAFIIFLIQFKVTYTNMVINVIGLFLIILISSISINCMLELPIRMIIKSQMNKKAYKEFNEVYVNVINNILIDTKSMENNELIRNSTISNVNY